MRDAAELFQRLDGGEMTQNLFDSTENPPHLTLVNSAVEPENTGHRLPPTWANNGDLGTPLWARGWTTIARRHDCDASISTAVTPEMATTMRKKGEAAIARARPFQIAMLEPTPLRELVQHSFGQSLYASWRERHTPETPHRVCLYLRARCNIAYRVSCKS